MYNFAIVALLGLATWKFVGMLLGLLKIDLDSSVRAFLTLGIGVLACEIIDYSVFAHWGVGLRASWMGDVFTGLIVGGFAYVWHYALGVVEAYGRHHRDEARAIEGRRVA
ncbi:MAG: hypothetical protein ABR552_06915 [Actinomycetota bacterium]